MKQIKTLVLVALLVLGVSQLQAQDKIAHINVSDLMSKMPEMQAAKAELEKLSLSYDNDYKIMVEEFQAKARKYEGEVATVSAALNEERGKELQDMQNRIVQFRDSAGQKLQEKEVELVKPIMEKAKAAIDKVAKDKGYKYVLDSTSGGSVIVAEGTNIYNEVKTALGF
ncbi:MAG: OmpH family outer membrane protein [Flavobacteriales bacterium]|nr:OmpH family outer membrane protein [Flavobacteriales bacterium]